MLFVGSTLSPILLLEVYGTKRINNRIVIFTDQLSLLGIPSHLIVYRGISTNAS